METFLHVRACVCLLYNVFVKNIMKERLYFVSRYYRTLLLLILFLIFLHSIFCYQM